ncbi:hypothetical protein GOD95_09900 [Paeniclostridium sordellii]|uniref:hypothetical protein n=1 Tax=Paraclostridium sordellii TaxID=1505 RepID=UPI0012EEC691|nr:hypothetical protein [Paeniclostridium sordellii]MVO71752.1 hypothetical protein [Paeniclostridium sordellii]
MATKKVIYYSFNIRDNIRGINLNSDDAKNLIKETINRIGELENNITQLVLDKESLKHRANIDIFHNDDDYLFGRVGKLKDGKDSLIRDINTLEANSLNPGEDKMLEIYTYFLLDYNNGIVGYVQNKSSHKPYIVQNIINSNHENYTMDLRNVVSGETVRALMKPGSKLGKIEYSFAVPDPRILAEIGMSRESAAELAEEGAVNVNISITNSKNSRNPLTRNAEIIQRLIGSFQTNNNISGKKFRGTPGGEKTQTFKFELENFNTPIDVQPTRVDEDSVVDLTLDELANEFFVRMRTSYTNNRRDILRFAGIE